MTRVILTAMALVAIALSNMLCSRAQSVNHVITMQQFVEAGGVNDAPDGPIHRLKGSATFNLTFPRFDVYSLAGNLIYHTTDLGEIRRFLDGFPRSAKNLHAISGTESWSSIASKYHLNDPSPPPTSPIQNRYTFLSLITEGCRACSIEQEFLNKASSRLSSEKIHQEILVLSP